MRTADVVRFIKNRENERLRKLGRYKGEGDHIIRKYRFCNVRRNDDRETIWIHENYLEEWRGDPFLWFAMVVARLFNNQDTLAEIKPYVLPFRPVKMDQMLTFRREAGRKNFNAAYIVSTNGRTGDKVTYLIEEVLNPLWKIRHNISAALKGATLADVHELFMRQNGLGSFMAAQVIADLKYADPARWKDFDTFAASGPGSLRGLKRVLDIDINKPMREEYFREKLGLLRVAVNKKLEFMGEPLTAQDLQNCLCEFDKYERARLDEGAPKQLYTPRVK